MENSQTKKCNNPKCNKIKPISEFSINKSKPDGRNVVCKSCKILIFDEYRKTKSGVATKIYGTQRKSSMARGHPMPSYTKKEFNEWLFSHDLFDYLYNNWVASGYKKSLVPSVDRKDDNIGYTVDNIQLMTWGENKAKAFRDMRSGKLKVTSNPQKPVDKYSIDGIFICSYHSIANASRLSDINHSHISDVCNGKRNTAGGFKWKHKAK